MCLYVKRRFVAKKPIIVYKIGYEGSMLVTPFQKTGIPFNQLYIDVKYNPSLHSKLRTFFKRQYLYISEGFIHSWTTKEIAEWAKDYLLSDIMFGTQLLKRKIFTAIIPKGAVGYYGLSNDICSNQIIVLNPNLPGYKEILSEYNIDESCV